ncbi:hypothetical protein BDZ45DRAFT_673892 [Acephala macrosclerotiorum]|nr:hypothetical protein BDZ45DRAFT_673892 [Acephala macrosclerotiorum]
MSISAIDGSTGVLAFSADFFGSRWNSVEIYGIGLPVNAVVARTTQEYFVNFAMTGKPNVNEKDAPSSQLMEQGLDCWFSGPRKLGATR